MFFLSIGPTKFYEQEIVRTGPDPRAFVYCRH